LCVSQSILISSFLAVTWSWDNIPQIPANRRAQFYLQDDNGGFQYGYDSDDGSSAQQKSISATEVEGSYSYVDGEGKKVDVKYTAGINGFVPEITIDGIPQTQFNVKQNLNSQRHGITQQNKLWKNYDESHASTNSDASYKISYNTGDHQREEISDSRGNVRGRYSYVDESGHHDLSYIAGPEIGYKVIGGSLAPNNGKISQQSHSSIDTDGSYNYEFNTGNHAKQEVSDSAGNVRGRYSYVDEAGQHDLSYISGDSTGFLVTGGSLDQKISDKIQQQSRSGDEGNAFFYRTETKHDSNSEKSQQQNLLVKTLANSQSSSTTGQSTLKFEETTTPIPRQLPNDQRDVNYAKHLHPSYTIITPEEGQRSFEYGVRNAIILGFIPPKHTKKFGYIYDTQ
jgi:Insect cuticle protein